MDISRLKEKKQELGYTNKQISDLTGIPLGTVQKIFGNGTRNPRRETYLALAKLLDPDTEYTLRTETYYVRETVAYQTRHNMKQQGEYAFGNNALPGEKKQGEYTLEDYYALPDERRVELIDGVIYDMTAPATLHQFIAGEVYYQLKEFHKKHKLACIPLISPVDVQLDCDDRTMVQPDVMILCDTRKLMKRVVFGAPELVLEVLSPSTRSKDQLIKLNKYHNAGCLEYWIIDPEKERVIVYDFTKDSWPEFYTFADKVPVGISEGKCEIDFSEVFRITEEVPGVYDDSVPEVFI